jgi:type IV fimbrial biogenesis protein FimT
MEAVKRNGNTTFCSDSSATNTSDTLGSACGTEAGAVYAVTSGTATTQVRAGVVGIATPLKLNGSMTALRFTGAGLAEAVGSTSPYAGTVADICTSALSANNHRVVTMATGSIIVTTISTGTCP